MRERPILFSAPMVRALLAGTKTQTRRVLAFPPSVVARGPRLDRVFYTRGSGQYPGGNPEYTGDQPPGVLVSCSDHTCQRVPCPFGVPGDRLWVRESGWYHVEHYEQDEDSECCSAEFFRWKATPREGCRRWLPPLDQTRVDRITFLHDSTPLEHAPKGDPRPSIFMPRWASRITLEVTGVRVERLQDISEEDAQAEGIRGPLIDPELDRMVVGQIGVMPREAFAKGWDSINGKRAPWASNPRVWVVEFRRVQP